MNHRTWVFAVCAALTAAGLEAKTVTVSNSGVTFSPDNASISVGDIVKFTLGGSHSALEVSKATYDADGNTALAGGFHAPFGGGTVSGLKAGTHYYVCENHYDVGMKGRITVQPATEILGPIRGPGAQAGLRIIDVTGRVLAEGASLAGDRDRGAVKSRGFYLSAGK